MLENFARQTGRRQSHWNTISYLHYEGAVAILV